MEDITEVYSEKQRKWACAQIKNKNRKISLKLAKEMCKSSIKEPETANEAKEIKTMKLTKQRIKEIIKEEIENMENNPNSQVNEMMDSMVDPQTVENAYKVLEALGPMLGGATITALIGALYSDYVVDKNKQAATEED